MGADGGSSRNSAIGRECCSASRAAKRLRPGFAGSLGVERGKSGQRSGETGPGRRVRRMSSQFRSL